MLSCVQYQGWANDMPYAQQEVCKYYVRTGMFIGAGAGQTRIEFDRFRERLPEELPKDKRDQVPLPGGRAMQYTPGKRRLRPAR